MELETEKFKALQELSALQVTLVATGAELKNLREELDQFKLEREKEAFEVVQMALLASREALVEADKNRDAVASLLGEAVEVANKVSALAESMSYLATKQKESVKHIKETVSAQVKMLQQKSDELNKQRIYVEDARANLSIRKKKIGEQEQKLFADMEMLKQDIARINKLN